MEDENLDITFKVQELGDLELAILLCLVSDQHCCIVEADEENINDVEQELRFSVQRTFGLDSTLIHLSSDTSLDDFGQAVLLKPEPRANVGANDYLDYKSTKPNQRHFTGPSPFEKLSSEGKIPNIIIARNLNLSTEQVQIQALELIRGRRIFSRTEVHVAPKNLLVISLQTPGSARLTHHLNDFMFLSHSHSSEDSLPHLHIQNGGIPDDVSDVGSMSSVIHTPPATPGNATTLRQISSNPVISAKDIESLIQRTSQVSMSADVRAYIHDIVIFLRTHRAIAAGVSAVATKHLLLLSRVLAPLHSLDFITPSLVALAARKIYMHRLVLVAPEREVSLQWGSSLEAVRELLHGVTVEDVIEEVLSNVETPL